MGKALLVIDMLNDFIREDGALCIGSAGEKIIPTVQGLIQEYRQENQPVIYIADNHIPGDLEFEIFPPHCLKGEEGAEIVSELKPEPPDKIIYKRRYSAFFGTELDLSLRELEVKELELCGVCTNICVLYTAADARMLNYSVLVRPQAVASFDPDAHSFALKEMEKILGVQVVSPER